jgi:hypothetical protein
MVDLRKVKTRLLSGVHLIPTVPEVALEWISDIPTEKSWDHPIALAIGGEP